MQMTDQEENLLDGIVAITSTSCPNPDFSGQFTSIPSEGHSLAIELQEQFKLSSNEDEEDRQVLKNLTEDTQELNQKVRIEPKRNSTHKNRYSIGKHSGKKQKQIRTLTDKKWQKLLQLDNKLVQVYCSGLLNQTGEYMSKISQLIITEQFCRLKKYEQKFLQNLKGIDFSFLEFQKQKKSLVNQINLLKADNQALRKTIDSLFEIIQQLQASVSSYFEEKKKQESAKHHQTSQCSFDTSFYQNQGESNPRILTEDLYSKIVTDQREKITKINLESLTQFIYQMKQKSASLLNPSKKSGSTKLYLSIVDCFSKDSQIRDWIVEIISNFHQLEQENNHSSFFSDDLPTQSRKTDNLSSFLQTFTKNRERFIKKIKNSQNSLLQFWFVVHSSIFTCIGLLSHQNRCSLLSVAPSNKNLQNLKKFIEEVEHLRIECSVNLNGSQLKYWNKLITFVNTITNRQ